MFDSPSILIFSSLAFVLAGTVKGVIGLGLPAVAVGLLGLLLPPAEAAALMIIPAVVTNIWQLAGGPDLRAVVRRLWVLLLGTSAGIVLGAALIPAAQTGGASNALGGALLLYAAVGLTAVRFTVAPRAEIYTAPVVGIITGIIAAPTGIFVMPAVPYMQAIGLDKDELIQALGLFFTVSTVVLAVVLTRSGVFHLQNALLSLAALIPVSAGMVLGQWMRSRIEAETFRQFFFVGLLLLGLHLALRGLIW